MYLRAQQKNSKGFNFSSGKVNIKKTAFSYGDVELRARAARGKGVSSVLSLTSGKWPPEISFNINGDIPNQVQCVLYYVEANKIRNDVRQYNSGNFIDQFRTYKITWDPNEIVWYVDGVEAYRVVDQNKIPNADLYLELLVNVGGSHLDVGSPDATTKFPSYLAVDYISISQWK